MRSAMHKQPCQWRSLNCCLCRFLSVALVICVTVQVVRMMRFLLQEQRLLDEHLDTIWAATEKPDQFEAVRGCFFFSASSKGG